MNYFTQLIWKNSTKFGVGIATSSNKVIVVAKYRTSGNIIGQYADNVLPKIGRFFKHNDNLRIKLFDTLTVEKK